MTSNAPNLASAGIDYYWPIDIQTMSALWNVLDDLITPEPRSGHRPVTRPFDTLELDQSP